MAQKIWAPSNVRNEPEIFLLHFNHTHIAFDQIVVKGDAEIIHKGQDASFMFV